ncbi:predicted protein [Naegleria gruberi]|uniref:Centrosomal protein of 19 kDa n=1 Tax=Naegleria gruberi TaxID=5762 RepID=D2UYG0_NAEGR|nr:uncharacterized protein NAEGRDRAFT_56519 [Naegleria gruberi]EFC50786.1 predicted protein [Naegleria gruberi]|eukprot:XP_002683530.1 predicted protein [Naegleria gruberi strain NEG-M]
MPSNNDDVNVLRIGIRLKLCALVIEYTTISKKGKKELRHRKIYLEDYIVQNYPELEEDELVEHIKSNVLMKHHKNLASHIPENQTTKMIRKLVDFTTKSFLPPDNRPQSIQNQSKPSPNTNNTTSKYHHQGDDDNFDEDEEDSETQQKDLNKLDDVTLRRVKAEMDKKFNVIRPGDEGYEYDKEVDFENVPKQQSSWDD